MTADESAAHNDDAERAVLGAMMLTNKVINDVTEALASSEDFYRPNHAAIYVAITTAHWSGIPTDPISLAERLAATGELGRLPGGAAYLHECIRAVPTPLQAGYYAGIVASHAERRRYALIGIRYTQAAEVIDPARRAEIVGQISAEASAISSAASGRTGLRARMRARLYDRDALNSIPPPMPLIDGGVLEVATIAILAGKFGTYKTFVSVAWACSVATGTPWFGHAVPDPGPVMYIAAEGCNGILSRVKAWETANDVCVPRDRLHVYDGRVKLNVAEEMAIFSEMCAEIRPKLLVIDTLHKCAPGVEENSATEMSVVLDAAADLREQHGLTVLFNHHTGHSGTRSRGTSSLEDDADTSWAVRLAGDGEDRSAANQRILVHRKVKNGVLLPEMPIELTEVAGTESACLVRGEAVESAGTTGWLVAESIARKLDDAGVPRSWGRDRVRSKCAELGIKVGTATLVDVVRHRQASEKPVPDRSES